MGSDPEGLTPIEPVSGDEVFAQQVAECLIAVVDAPRIYVACGDALHDLGHRLIEGV